MHLWTVMPQQQSIAGTDQANNTIKLVLANQDM